MSAGLKIWNADGSVRAGPGTPFGTILGVVADTTKFSGSKSVPEFAQAGGTPSIFAVIPLESGNYITVPKISINSNSVSWTYDQSGANFNGRVMIVYGVT